jgi:hypothetical protein
MEGGRVREPRVSVSRRIFALPESGSLVGLDGRNRHDHAIVCNSASQSDPESAFKFDPSLKSELSIRSITSAAC